MTGLFLDFTFTVLQAVHTLSLCSSFAPELPLGMTCRISTLSSKDISDKVCKCKLLPTALSRDTNPLDYQARSPHLTLLPSSKKFVAECRVFEQWPALEIPAESFLKRLACRCFEQKPSLDALQF